PVPVQVADDRVDLCERESHEFSTSSRKLSLYDRTARIAGAALLRATVLLAGCGNGQDRVRAGKKLFFGSGCLLCHTYGGQGSRSLGAPDMTHEALKGRGVPWQVRHLRCPSCLVQNS